MPRLVNAPLPMEPSKVKCVASTLWISQVPFAAVFPRTPATIIVCPVVQLCAGDTVICIGDAFVACAMTAASGVAFIEHIVLIPEPPLKRIPEYILIHIRALSSLTVLAPATFGRMPKPKVGVRNGAAM